MTRAGWYLELQGVCVIGARVKVGVDAGSATEVTLVAAVLLQAPSRLLTGDVGLDCHTA